MEDLANEHGHCGSMSDLRQGVVVALASRRGPFAGGRPAAPSMDAIDARDIPARCHSEAVHGELFRVLPRGEPTIETVAQALALTPSMLSRRLAEEGTTFRQALADLRRRLAIQYVEGTGLAVDQIAMLLGYGHAASFRHAFRRWTGASVTVARQALAVTTA